jgi:UDP-N-acetyl-D-mannosaminuronate dehydrogenase
MGWRRSAPRVLLHRAQRISKFRSGTTNVTVAAVLFGRVGRLCLEVPPDEINSTDRYAWQRSVVVKKLRLRLHGLRGRRVGILGLSFKPGPDDLRDSPAIEVATTLVTSGARVLAHDPIVQMTPDVPALLLVDEPYEVAERADAVVLMTEWPDYRELELDVIASRMRGRLLVDDRNVFDPVKAEYAGLVYEGIGRPSSLARV